MSSGKSSEREEVSFLLNLLERYSPTGSVEGARDYLVDKLREYGLHPTVLSRGGILCQGGDRRRVLLCGHLDTVPGMIPVRFDGRILSGRGVVDAKGPLAAIVQALRLSVDHMDLGYVLIVSVDEEGRSVSTIEALERCRDGFMGAVVGEPSRTCGVTVSYYGMMAVEAFIQFKPMHPSASAWFGDPMERLFRFSITVSDRLRSRVGRKVVIQPIRSDRAQDYCRLSMEIRYPQDAGETVRSTLLEASKEFECEFRVLVNMPPYTTPEDAKVLSRMLNSIKASGLKPRLIRKTSTSDMNIIGAFYGVPCVAYGPGNPRLSHTWYERIRIQDYLKSVEVLCRFLKGNF